MKEVFGQILISKVFIIGISNSLETSQDTHHKDWHTKNWIVRYNLELPENIKLDVCHQRLLLKHFSNLIF